MYSFMDAYELKLCLHFFRQTGPPRHVGFLASPSVMKIVLGGLFPPAQPANYPVFSPRHPGRARAPSSEDENIIF